MKLTRREWLHSLPLLVVTARTHAQVSATPLRVRGLHQVTLAVSDVERSLEFYQALFGMPVQARHEKKVLLRIGEGPHFLALTEAGAGSPRIDHFGMAIEDFDAARIVRLLTDHGLSEFSGREGLSGRPLRVQVSTRDTTTAIHMVDPNGLVIELMDPRHCGGEGRIGDECGIADGLSSPGAIAVQGLSHLTINVSEPAVTNTFYRETFGFDIQAFQATAPLLGAGPDAHFLMFIGLGRASAAAINHACLTLEDFDVDRIQTVLEDHGLQPRGESRQAGPLRHWISMRMPNRGGAPEGTPELYFSDPDGLSIQLQDVTYCGGGGYLGGQCS